MATAKKARQLSIEIPNSVGLLAAVGTALSKAKVNIEALCAYEMAGTAYFMLITDDPAKGKKALATLGGKTVVDDVITIEIPNKTGAIEKVAGKIAEAGIDIVYIYGTAGKCRTPLCVIKTVDDRKALKALNK
ncbi:MAG TPA: hypothetical protein VMB78_05870 [Dissulfurispiraceae bacterium]|nr:hypothetical protein [Dissulfurispiraceae bacterium]